MDDLLCFWADKVVQQLAPRLHSKKVLGWKMDKRILFPSERQLHTPIRTTAIKNKSDTRVEVVHNVNAFGPSTEPWRTPRLTYYEESLRSQWQAPVRNRLL